MEEKLKSISNQIPWSLVLKACVFALAWLELPFWLFLVVAAYIYFFPLFQPGKVFLPFLLTIVLAWAGDPNIWAAIFLGALFFLVLGIKDLVIVERDTAYNLLIFVLYFLIFFYSFLSFEGGITSGAVLAFAFASLVFFLLTRGMLSYGDAEEDKKKERLTILAFVSFIIFELGLAALFLPLSFFYQTTVLFFAGVIFFEIYVDYVKNRLFPRKLLFYFSVFFAALTLVLVIADFAV